MLTPQSFRLVAFGLSAALPLALILNADEPVTNSIGLRLVPIAAGEFQMGSTVKPANWDEQPVHRVAISQPLLISETEVTVEQFKLFKPDAVLNPAYSPFAAGVSWHDAVAFCEWLSKRDGKLYRLPTEAEWEYVARAGRGDGAEWEKKANSVNPWGLKNVFTGPVEWCADWYGEYALSTERDPAGYSAGFTKVVRGGYLDEDEKFKPDNYLRPSNRAAAAPSFGPNSGSAPNPEKYGVHRIGFRVVQAGPVTTALKPLVPVHAMQGIKFTTAKEAKQGPDPSKPYFRRRPMLPMPLEGDMNYVKAHRAGLHPSFLHHNHSPGFEVLPNGDTLLVIYSSDWEYEPEVTLIAARLRFGADQWDMPSPFIDTPGANDHAPLLSVEGDTLRLFWGNPYAEGHFPFQYIVSKDQGATWSAVNFPRITGPLGRDLDRPQPINSTVRDRNGTLYMAVDAGGGGPLGSQSMLWATDDEGATWRDTLGRTFGRHTTFVLKKDGSILAMGGKNSHLEGFMPQGISRDGGRTYEMSKTPFSAVSSGQRPSILRLASGRLFMAGDFYPSKRIEKAASIKEEGSYVALSDDDGETWRIKKLPGNWSVKRNAPSIGYSVARQAPNGVIHLITSSNRPSLHYELNEAWILSDANFADDDPVMNQSRATKIGQISEHRENYESGIPRITWSSGVADDGRVLLHGLETWFYANGKKQREVTYRLGVKTGREINWAANGAKESEWDHRADGTSLWRTWWPDGSLRSESTWKDFRLVADTDRLFEPGAVPPK
ncbi:SUMF1/EgtB/PvdO family nonheme iron enzyme [Oleiharenicola lentus]|uniref:SUMF1/EgtB/PvdO family nonheme iron enzyme n=1 Tax=Oleiharenicola lentus TaxID=2508720 RepID=UPI003F678842